MLSPLTILALDVGGSSVKSALVKDSQLLTEVKKTPMASQGQAPDILRAFEDIIASYQDFEALVFAFPGPFDYQNGVCYIEGLDKYGKLYGMNLRALLAPEKPSRFCNDAEAAIRGEALLGAGQGFERILGITLGTGLGSAFLVGGQSVTKGRGVPEGGWLYNQPFEGQIADEVFSIRGLKNRAEKAGLGSVEPNEITDPQVWQDFGSKLGQFLQPFVKDFDAQAVLVLGGISGAYSEFGPALDEQLGGLSKSGILDGSAPLLGAASAFNLPGSET